MKKFFISMVFVFSALPCVAQVNGARQNVILLSVDTLRADHLSGYGYKRRTTPNIDALMSRGIRFERAYCAEPLTAPSFASVMTSRYPHETGCTRNGLKMLADYPTLAELLKKSGYVTGAIQSNWTLKAQISDLNRGFDYYDDDFRRMRYPMLTERDAKYVTYFALEWLDKRQKGKPFFLWAHYSDPHSPYVLRSEFKFPLMKGEGSLSPGYRYDTEVAHADKHIGILLDGLKKRGLLENTLIVFIADHGESLGERDYYGHGRQLYESSVKVPMAIVGSGIRTGLIESPAQIIDVMPTILSLLGIATAPAGIRGETLIGADGTERPLIRRELFFETYRGVVPDVPGAEKVMPGLKPLLLGVKQGSWKFIYSCETRTVELYDTENDHEEMKNLASSRADVASEMKKKTLAWFESTRPTQTMRQPLITEETKRKLKSLGYIQ